MVEQGHFEGLSQGHSWWPASWLAPGDLVCEGFQ